jgi:hypothetical protein
MVCIIHITLVRRVNQADQDEPDMWHTVYSNSILIRKSLRKIMPRVGIQYYNVSWKYILRRIGLGQGLRTGGLGVDEEDLRIPQHGIS